MDLKVLTLGQVYVTRNGKLIRIEGATTDETLLQVMTHPYIGRPLSSVRRVIYTREGKYFMSGRYSPHDIMRLATPEDIVEFEKKRAREIA